MLKISFFFSDLLGLREWENYWMLMLGVETSLLDWYEVSIALRWDSEWEDLSNFHTHTHTHTHTHRGTKGQNTKHWEVRTEKNKIKLFDSKLCGVLDLWGEKNH